MGRQKRCTQGGNCHFTPFKIKRKDKKKKKHVITKGVRCKWCKKPQGKHDHQVASLNK